MDVLIILDITHDVRRNTQAKSLWMGSKFVLQVMNVNGRKGTF